MEDKLVSIDLARGLKIVGFNYKTTKYVVGYDSTNWNTMLDAIDSNGALTPRDFNHLTTKIDSDDPVEEGWYTSIPTQDLAVRWLRSEHRLFILLIPNIKNGSLVYTYSIIRYNSYNELQNMLTNSVDLSYDGAMEEALRFALNMV